MPLCEGADVVAEHFVGAIHNDGDSREDEGIFGHGLTAGAANHGLTNQLVSASISNLLNLDEL